jgi:glyoxylase-like metal-dependent hydrolase (beta-lactamase superfamily II)
LRRSCVATLAVGLLAALASCNAQTAGPKLTVFDCGRIVLDDVALFGLSNEETSVRELFVPCYLVEHAGGRLLWDGGLPLSAVGQGEVELQPGARMSYARGLQDQLAEIGLTPGDIDRVAFSHMHFDHVGAANLFAHATLWIQRPEYEAAFLHGQESEVFDPSFNAGREQTLAAMERVEAIVEETGATLWIEHDKALADGLRLAPASYD